MKVYRQWILSLIAALIPVSILSAEEMKPWSIGASAEYYLPGTIDDGIQGMVDANKAIDSQTSTVSEDVKTSASGGVRVSLFRNVNSRLSFGPSVGYVIAPNVDANYYITSGTPFTVNEKFKTNYLRALLEAQGRLPINEKFGFSLGVGAGIAQGRSKFDYSDTDGETFSKSEDEVGFTWEVSPGMYWNLNRTTLALGLRYIQMPKIEVPTSFNQDYLALHETDKYEIEWKTIGFYASLLF